MAANTTDGNGDDTAAASSSSAEAKSSTLLLPPPPPSPPLVSLRAKPCGPQCPFGNDVVEFHLRTGCCVHLSGVSGIGKTTLANVLAGLLSAKRIRRTLGIELECTWDDSIPERERCGVLFQQTTLLDELTVAGNLHLALKTASSSASSSSASSSSASSSSSSSSSSVRMMEIKRLLESVGLDYARDAGKRPTELSGGMARRASLALQLAQRKRIIVLDEPFTGLDHDSAVSVAKELVHLRSRHGTAFLLISHEPHLVDLIMDRHRTHDNQVVRMVLPTLPPSSSSYLSSSSKSPTVAGTTFFDRFAERLADYILWSLPLILLTFTACGLAIAMLSSDILRRIDVTEQVLEIVDKEVKPLIKALTGEEPSMFTMMGVQFKVRSMLNTAVPPAKATLYAIGMAHLFVLEVGPLLTALLLSGRIGGSYAGRIATLRATSQSQLLRTLGVSPLWWSLYPALSAALVASPILTVVGTTMAIGWGSLIGPNYGIGTQTSYLEEVRSTVFPELRLRCCLPPPPSLDSTMTSAIRFYTDIRPIFSDSYSDGIVEIMTHPVAFHLLKSIVFMTIIMLVAETAARIRSNLTPRKVPAVITSAVVTASLLIIITDWGFSQLWLLRK